MAKRPSVKEILEAARKAGAAKPADEIRRAGGSGWRRWPDAPEAEAVETEAAAAAPAASVATPATLGRPLTLKEKLAAARAGGAAAAAARRQESGGGTCAAEEAAAAAPARSAQVGASTGQAAGPADDPCKKSWRPPAARQGAAAAGPLGRPSRPVPSPPRPPRPRRRRGRCLRWVRSLTPKILPRPPGRPPPRRRRKSPPQPRPRLPPRPRPSPARPSPDRSPRPTRELAVAQPPRRGRSIAAASSWVACSSRGASPGSSPPGSPSPPALSAMTLMCVRFMFPNVLAEPPSTIKVGLPDELRARRSQRALQGRVGLLDRPVDALRRPGYHLRSSVGLHAPGLPAQLAGRRAEIQVPVPRQRLLRLRDQFRGPRARPLERFKVALADDGQIMVDKSQKFQQELGQWSDPDSFIPA